VNNTASHIQFVPVATGYPENRLEIRTCYSGSGGGPLTTVRTITSPFIITEA